LEKFFKTSKKKGLNLFIDKNNSLVKQLMKHFDNAGDCKKNLEAKFKHEYKKLFPHSKRCPSKHLNFETLWYEAMADKALEIEQNRLSVPLLQSTTVLVTQRMDHNNNINNINNRNNSSNNNSNSSNNNSIDSTDVSDSEEAPFITNETVFVSSLHLTDETPSCLREFQNFQQRSFLKGKSDGLFVNAHMFEIL
ncbi:hypothetical protein BCV71DRAFT_191323, partial [Rhizopus microsporus]